MSEMCTYVMWTHYILSTSCFHHLTGSRCWPTSCQIHTSGNDEETPDAMLFSCQTPPTTRPRPPPGLAHHTALPTTNPQFPLPTVACVTEYYKCSICFFLLLFFYFYTRRWQSCTRSAHANICLTWRDVVGVGNGTSPQLAPDNNRMLENTAAAAALNAANDKVRKSNRSESLCCFYANFDTHSSVFFSSFFFLYLWHIFAMWGLECTRSPVASLAPKRFNPLDWHFDTFRNICVASQPQSLKVF